MQASCLKLTLNLLVMLLVAPAWYYLLYRILQEVNADTVMWTIFWAYVPVSVALRLGIDIVDAAGKAIDDEVKKGR